YTGPQTPESKIEQLRYAVDRITQSPQGYLIEKSYQIWFADFDIQSKVLSGRLGPMVSTGRQSDAQIDQLLASLAVKIKGQDFTVENIQRRNEMRSIA